MTITYVLLGVIIVLLCYAIKEITAIYFKVDRMQGQIGFIQDEIETIKGGNAEAIEEIEKTKNKVDNLNSDIKTEKYLRDKMDEL